MNSAKAAIIDGQGMIACQRLTGLSTWTVRLLPGETERPGGGYPIAAFCAKAVAARKTRERTDFMFMMKGSFVGREFVMSLTIEVHPFIC